VKLDFLSPGAEATQAGVTPIARSPMESSTRAAGAHFEVREGWNVAVGFGASAGGGAERERGAALRTAGWADVSHLGKLELQAPAETLTALVAGATAGAEPEFGRAIRAADAWWCRLTRTRALVICDTAVLPALRGRLAEAAAASSRASVVDVTSTFAALTLVGPLAREVLARFSALDLRPARTPIHALRPGSIGRQPAILICEAEDRYLFLFGWAIGEYMWSIVADAGTHLGGGPIGIDALAAIGPLGGNRPAEAARRA
jgi:glycine cleavage system aminomethyltransferase T